MARKSANAKRPSGRSAVKRKKSAKPRSAATVEMHVAERIGRALFAAEPTPALDQRTCAGHVFGETSVLSNNAEKLKEARRFIAAVAYKRNGAGMAKPRIPAEEELKNPNTKAIWERCEAAAKEAAQDDVGTCKHFVIWYSDDAGKTPSKKPEKIEDDWPYTEIAKITESYGPFKSPIKPKGENIYLIKYCGVPWSPPRRTSV